MPEPKSPFKRVRRAYRQGDLKRVCEMRETDFGAEYGMEKWVVEGINTDDNFYYYKDNGSNILAVAHLDTVVNHEQRTAHFMQTAAGPIIYSGALDDRLGAYTILELLPALGIQYDILLTVGEESGRSTAQYFQVPEDKDYHWMIEFDRGGRDCVMYQYEDTELRNLVKDSGATPAIGIFSDISYMDHLEVKGINWGVGYRDYHGPRSHAFLNDYWEMLGYFLKFHDANADTYLPHDKDAPRYTSTFGSGSHGKYGSTYGGSMWGAGGWGMDDDDKWLSARDAIDKLSDEEIMEDLDDMIDLDKDDVSEVDLDDLVSEDYDTVRTAMQALANDRMKELEAPAAPPLPAS